MAGYSLFTVKAIQAALAAGRVILEIYDSEFAVEYKADNSPLTRADRQSNDLIIGALSRFKIPVLSEEGREIPYQERKTWERLWIVDPLDGTKEFIKRNGEFTVNIALVEYGLPVLGVVFAPVKDVLYFAAKGIGAHKTEKVSEHRALLEAKLSAEAAADRLLGQLMDISKSMPERRRPHSPFTVVGSRSHAGPELKKFVEEKRREHGAVEFISAGSSLKICLVAEGRADIYPRLGPTCEWDTAAGQAVAEYAGAKLLNFKTGEPLRYNRDDLLNPWFIVRR
jgi:3'(2'), 5'-bisphosphate nucleotidase